MEQHPADQPPARAVWDELEKPTVDRRLRRLPALLRDALQIVRRSGGGVFWLAVAVQVVAAAAVLVQLLVVRSLLSTLVSSGRAVAFADLGWQLAVLVLCLAVIAAATVARAALQELLADLAGRETLDRVLARAGTVDLLAYETSQLHDRLQRALFNATFRPLQMTSGMLAVLAGAGGSVGVSIALLAISPLFFVLALAAAVPVWLVGLVSSRVMYRFAYAQTGPDRERMYLQELQSDRREAKELRAYDLNEHLRALWRANYDRRIAQLRGVVRRRIRGGLGAAALSAVLLGGAVTVLVELVRTGRLGLGGAAAALGGLLLLGGQLQTLGGGVGAVYESALFVQDYTRFVAGADTDGSSAAEPPRGFAGTTPVPLPLAEVRAESLGFTYPAATVPALREVSMTVAAGEVVALVGENGSGKSTLSKLLAGLYPPASGRISWNGVDYAQLSITSVREQIAVLFQDFVHYELSLADNVRFGRWRAPDDGHRLDDAARTAGAEGIVAALPGGWATRMGPQFAGGVELSGGQWQRLAIARALYRDASLVVLDEPTASLDPRAEAALFDAVRTLFAGRAVVLVSHRFGSVRHADRIYVLHRGAIVEQGTHETLLAQNGRYAELFRLQRAAMIGDLS